MKIKDSSGRDTWLLEVGDVVYTKTRYHFDRHVIDRITKTRAFAGSIGFVRIGWKYQSTNQVYFTSYPRDGIKGRLETPKLNALFKHEERKNMLQRWYYDNENKFTLDEIEIIKHAVTEHRAAIANHENTKT